MKLIKLILVVCENTKINKYTIISSNFQVVLNYVYRRNIQLKELKMKQLSNKIFFMKKF